MIAPGLVGTVQDSDGGGRRHRLPPPTSGNSSWRGSPIADRARRRRLGRASERRFAREFGDETSHRSGACPSRQQARDPRVQVIDTERDPVVLPEIELGSIAMQVRFAHVKVAAEHAALEDRKEVFDRVGMPELRPDIFLDRVVDGAMPAKLPTYAGVDWAIVGHQIRRLAHVRDDDRLQGLRGHVRHMEAPDRPSRSTETT